MSIADEIVKHAQTIGLSVTIGGTTQTAFEARVRHGVEQDAGQATVVLPAHVPNLAGQIVDVQVSVNGVSAQLFYGTATGLQYEHWAGGVAVDCRDRMTRLNFEYGGSVREYTETTEGTIIQNLVEAMGIDSADTSIEDSGWTVAVVEAITFEPGDRFLPFIREIDELAGYATFTRSNGAIYRRPIVYGTSTWTFAEDTNVFSARRSEAIEGIYNAVQIDGLTYEGLTVSAFVGTANADIPDPPGTVALRKSSNYVETDSRATVVAEAMLTRVNRRPVSYSIEVPGNPLIEPAITITLDIPSVNSGGSAWVASREHVVSTSDGFVTTIEAREL